MPSAVGYADLTITSHALGNTTLHRHTCILKALNVLLEGLWPSLLHYLTLGLRA